MYKSTKNLTLALLVGVLLALPLSSQAAFKCWTNKQGVRECGNAIPPEYSQQKSETMDERGLTVDVQERAKSKREIEAERRKKAEEERRQAEEEKQRKAQANRDRVLLATFLTEEDIISARDRKLAAIDGSIELSRITLDKLQEDLDRENKQAEKHKSRGRDVPENLQKSIDSLESQIADKKRYIASKQQDKEELREKYAQDLQRFRELKASGRRLR